MWNKKVRGQKRRLRTLLQKIESPTDPFGETDRFKGLQVPGSPWIEMPKTSGKVKTAFCRKWISEAEELIRQTPDNIGFCKVVGMIVYPELWNSEIIIFRDEAYFNTFWDRKGPYQTWSRISGRSFAAERGIITDLTEVGYIEELVEDDYRHRSYLWFYMDGEREDI